MFAQHSPPDRTGNAPDLTPAPYACLNQSKACKPCTITQPVPPNPNPTSCRHFLDHDRSRRCRTPPTHRRTACQPDCHCPGMPSSSLRRRAPVRPLSDGAVSLRVTTPGSRQIQAPPHPQPYALPIDPSPIAPVGPSSPLRRRAPGQPVGQWCDVATDSPRP
jgi:hypothetical protein